MAYTQGELLVQARLITADSHRRALAMRAAHRGSLGECLIELGVIDEDSLASFYHKRLVLPLLLEASLQQVARAVLAAVPVELATEFRVLPIAIDREGALLVAMADPSDNHAVEELGFFTSRFILRAVAKESAVRRAIERHYDTKLGPDETAATVRGTPVPVLTPNIAPKIAPKVATPIAAQPAPGTPLFPGNVDERGYDPFGRTTGKTRAPEPVVVLTRKKRSDETPLPPHAPPPQESAVEARPAAPLVEDAPHLLTQSRGRKRTGTLTGLHPEVVPPPLPALRVATQRDEVAALILDYAAGVMGRAALFVARGNSLAGFDARGDGLDRATVELLQVPLAADSLFRDATLSRLPYRGGVPDTVHSRAIARVLGSPADAEVVLLPILVRDRVVALLYGDSVSRVLPEAALQALCYEAGVAYERILRQARVNAEDNGR